jgi:hypothetical protein
MEKCLKLVKKYECVKCDFVCSKLSNYNKHISTPKHIQLNVLLSEDIKNAKKMPQAIQCECGNVYKHQSGLWRHKKTCNYEGQSNVSEIQTLTNLVLDVVKSNTDLQKQNQELQKQMMEMCKNGLNSNNTTNSHNKTFNLSVFLNEQCKDAMNMKDFVDSIQLQYSDLENVGRLGFVNGISDIIIKSLKALDIHRRPVHCADLKREIMYVKDNNEWIKEEDNNKIRRAIKCIAQKNSKNLVLFKQKHPDCMQGDSRSSDRYNKLMVEAFGGGKADDETNEDKIIRRISKEVTIDKSH